MGVSVTNALRSVLKFAAAVSVTGVRYELVPRGAAYGRIAQDDITCSGVSDRLSDIPEPRAFNVSGRLDEIKHGNGRFRLVAGKNATLFERIEPTSLDVEAL